MKENRVKRILGDGGLALGTHVGGIADPQIVEIIGLAGFDAAFIDMEHTSFDLRDIQLMVMAAERAGITPVVRTPGFDPAFILRLLDMGVQGVQVPHVSSAETWARLLALRIPLMSGNPGLMSMFRDAFIPAWRAILAEAQTPSFTEDFERWGRGDAKQVCAGINARFDDFLALIDPANPT